MAKKHVSKILVNSSIDTVRFDYEISLNKFTTRSDFFTTNDFTPPGWKEPILYMIIYPNNMNFFAVKLFLKKSSYRLIGKTTSWLVTNQGSYWTRQGI